ncbi:unnamed protein product [Diplocarpon coronariae]
MDEGAPERHTSRRPPSGPPGSSGVDLGSEKRRGRIRAAPTDSTIRWMQEDTKAGPRIRGLAGTNCGAARTVPLRKVNCRASPSHHPSAKGGCWNKKSRHVSRARRRRRVDCCVGSLWRGKRRSDQQESSRPPAHPPPGLDVHGFHRMPHPGAHVWRARKWRDRREVGGEEVLVYRKCVLLAWGFVLS